MHMHPTKLTVPPPILTLRPIPQQVRRLRIKPYHITRIPVVHIPRGKYIPHGGIRGIELIEEFHHGWHLAFPRVETGVDGTNAGVATVGEETVEEDYEGDPCCEKEVEEGLEELVFLWMVMRWYWDGGRTAFVVAGAVTNLGNLIFLAAAGAARRLLFLRHYRHHR